MSRIKDAQRNLTNEWLDANLSELLWVTDTGSLKDERRAQSTAGNNDLLASFDDARWQLTSTEWLSGDKLYTNSSVALKDDLTELAYKHLNKIAVSLPSQLYCWSRDAGFGAQHECCECSREPSLIAGQCLD